jgi:hypothetical protein
MKNINMNLVNLKADFSEARREAAYKAAEVLSKPVIIAWKDDEKNRFAPEIPGGKENMGGRLELTVGNNFHFIFTEAEDFEEPDLNLTSIEESDGNTILCTNNACSEEDRMRMGYFSGGGIGG